MARVEKERVEVTSRAEWRAWLEEHHATSLGIWLSTQPKQSASSTVSSYDVCLSGVVFFQVTSQIPRLVAWCSSSHARHSARDATSTRSRSTSSP